MKMMIVAIPNHNATARKCQKKQNTSLFERVQVVSNKTFGYVYLTQSKQPYSHAVNSNIHGNSSRGLPHVSASNWKQKILSRTSRGGTLHKMSTTTSVPLRQDILGNKPDPNFQHINLVLECRIIWPGQSDKDEHTTRTNCGVMSLVCRAPSPMKSSENPPLPFPFARFHVWF